MYYSWKLIDNFLTCNCNLISIFLNFRMFSRRPKRRVNSIFNSSRNSDQIKQSESFCEYPPRYSHISRIRTRQKVWDDGYRCFRKGDIVRITDSDDRKDYFAQISELIVDKYAEKYAMVVWLVPKMGTSAQNTNQFDPKCYELALAEERPIPISACEFERHCPNFPQYSYGWTPDDVLKNKIRQQLCQQIDANNNT